MAGRPQRDAVGGDAGRIMDPHGRRRRQPRYAGAAQRGAPPDCADSIASRPARRKLQGSLTAARRAISASRSRMTLASVLTRSITPRPRNAGVVTKPGQRPLTSMMRARSTPKPAFLESGVELGCGKLRLRELHGFHRRKSLNRFGASTAWTRSEPGVTTAGREAAGRDGAPISASHPQSHTTNFLPGVAHRARKPREPSNNLRLWWMIFARGAAAAPS
jgi:hypothetical protein